MPNNLNEVSCGVGTGGNIGETGCDYNLLKAVGLIAIPPTVTIPTSALAGIVPFRAWLKTAMQSTSFATRVFLIGSFFEATSNGSDPTYYTAPDGTKVLVKDAIRGVRYEIKGGFCYFRQLMKANLYGYKFLELYTTTISGDLLAVGTTITDATTNVKTFDGVTKSFIYAEPPLPPANNEPERYYIQMEDSDIYDITLRRSVFNVGSGLLPALKPIAVKDVVLDNRTPSGASAGVFTVRPSLSCGAQSLAELVPAIASATYILVTNATTGAAIVPTTVAIDTTDPANVVITLPVADANYPAAGGYLAITIAGLPVVLVPIGAYESTQPLLVPRS